MNQAESCNGTIGVTVERQLKRQVLALLFLECAIAKNMKDRRDRMKLHYDAVGRIFLEDWDPIGVDDVPEAQGEYDSYVPGVCELLTPCTLSVKDCE